MFCAVITEDIEDRSGPRCDVNMFSVGVCSNPQVMVTNVTSLLKTVKTVEDEAARGTRALESSIEAISQEIKVRTGPAASGVVIPVSLEEWLKTARKHIGNVVLAIGQQVSCLTVLVQLAISFM